MALDAIRNKTMSIRLASKKYGVPRSTLFDRWSRRTNCLTALTAEEENQVVEFCVSRAKSGLPCKINDVMNAAEEIARNQNRDSSHMFENGRPGKKWCYAFLRRNFDKMTKDNLNCLTKGVNLQQPSQVKSASTTTIKQEAIIVKEEFAEF